MTVSDDRHCANVGAANAVPKLALQMQYQSWRANVAVMLARNDVLATIFLVLQEVNATCRYSNDKIRSSGQISRNRPILTLKFLLIPVHAIFCQK